MKIHPTAAIDASARLADDVEIGAFSVVSEGVVIGPGTRLRPHVVIEPYVTIGAGCDIFSGAVLGGVPQDRKFHGERSSLRLGDNNIIREHVTIHRAAGEGEETILADNNLIMAYCHIGHNCVLGSGITMASFTGISGHSLIEDGANFGGSVGVHQFVRVGRMAMIGGISKVVRDVPPFMMADGRPCEVVGLNVRGLRRAGVSDRSRADLKQAYKLLYRSQLNTSQAVEAIEAEIEPGVERDYLLDFIRQIRFGSNGRQNDLPHI